MGSIFDVADTGAPVWPIAGMAVIDWFGRGGGGIPNILGGCAEPGKGRGGVAYSNSKIQVLGCWLDVEEWIWKFMCYFILLSK